MAMDVLSIMITQAQQSGLINGFRFNTLSPPLTHLFFADDSLLFAEANVTEATNIIQVLNLYNGASGQRINVTKSGLIFGKNTVNRTKRDIASLLHMPIWEHPGQYLGLPAIWGRSKCNSLAWVKEKVREKIEGWKETLLNQAGKEVLIKAIIQAIPSYAMAIVYFPKVFCNSLSSMVSNFWWKGQGKERGIHWRSWEKLTLSKEEGGMGFRDFRFQNLAILAKQAWRVLTNPEALWVRVLKSIYFPSSNFLHAKLGCNPSWMWRSLLEGRDFITRFSRWAVGGGHSIKVWGDNWLSSGDALIQPTNAPDLMVSDLVSPNGEGWNIDLIRGTFQPDLALKILQTPRVFSQIQTMALAQPVKENTVKEDNLPQTVRSVDWFPPHGNNLKINVDASWVANLPHASIGVLIRDKFSTLQAGSSAKIFASSTLTAEACAIREGLVLDHNLDCPQVVLESDNKQLVEACNSGFLIGETSAILQDISYLRGQFHRCEFVWANRERNISAHQVAKLCMEDKLLGNWMFNPPQELRSSLVEDAKAAALKNGFPNHY
ncbi:uncharacterized protein LOC130719921 [Lotus japonicus]|uniref:uncharacterized protein LOC130719921 n=1 Tax=Lotus japonicus TaxID=34305 RepID=UPI00258E7421|nr:uncharacterized protein LOC130719921 [Lotus japonicus]